MWQWTRLVSHSATELMEKFVDWARTQHDIVAVINQGSRARVDHPADEWADLDLIVFTNAKEKYLGRSDWLEKFGKPILTHLEETAVGGEVERRAIFEGGIDVDFSIISAELLKENVDRPSVQDLDMIRRGVRILFDRTGTIQAALAKQAKDGRTLNTRPSKEEFDQTVDDFAYHVYWTAKKLRRGELWTAKACCDGYMKRKLLRMIEWNTLARRGWHTDIWFNGRFLEEWASPETVKELAGVFAHYDHDDVERALFATTDMFVKLALETGEMLRYESFMPRAEPVIELARSCLHS